MITEDYVSFETAKLLKEKGFDEHCFCINYPLPEGGHHNIILPNLLNNSMIPFTDDYKFCRYKEDFITIPTLQMAMKWLREVYKFEVRSAYDYDKESWWGNINPMFEETDENSGIYQKVLGFDYQGKSYEEACEAAIKYSLENLIK